MKLIFVLGFLFITLLGTYLHFVYENSNHNKVVALFGAVNESIWEHIKIAMTPYFLWSLLDGFMYGYYNNYFLAKVLGLLTIIVFMPLLFYSYTKITKKHILVVDIIIFVLVVFLGQCCSYFVLNKMNVSYLVNYLSVLSLFIIFGFYMIGTLMPIKSNLFEDPSTNKYGIDGHTHHHNHSK